MKLAIILLLALTPLSGCLFYVDKDRMLITCGKNFDTPWFKSSSQTAELKITLKDQIEARTENTE